MQQRANMPSVDNQVLTKTFERAVLANLRERLEKEWDGGGPPPPADNGGGGGGGGGGQTKFQFVDADTFCELLEEFARDATTLASDERSPDTTDAKAPASPEQRRKFAHYFDFSGYAERLRSRASAARATATPSQTFFVVCQVDGEVISVLHLDEGLSVGDRPGLRLRSIDWPIERLSYKFFMVPPRVVGSKLKLRPWLETQGYNLQDDACDPYGI
jgi:hypothetical protein